MTESLRKVMLLLLTSVLFLGMASCSKDKDSAPVTKTDLLTSKSWKIESVGVDIDKNGTIDQYLDIESCLLDDQLSFLKDGTGTYAAGTELCDGDSGDDQTFNWAFKENESILNFTIPGLFSGDGKIKVLSESVLEVYDQYDMGAGITVNRHLILKH